MTAIYAIALDPAGVAAAFAAGFVSFISPCVWPLVPAYLSLVSGVAFADLEANQRRVVTATSWFVLGFGAVFTLYGVGAGIAGDQLTDHRRTFEVVGGIAVIVMGVILAGLGGTLLQRQWRLPIVRKGGGPLGACLAGVAFAIGWTPCIGPTLTAIIALAASEGGALRGAVLLAAYSLGLGVPFLLTGVYLTRALSAAGSVRRHAPLVMRISGAVLVVTGILLLTGELTAMTRELSTFAPDLAT